MSRIQSDRLPRWLAPPPARTAAFSSARSPGVVLRVSHTRAADRRRRPRSTKRRVQRGDARQVAQEVQRGALGREDRRQRPVDGGRWPCPATTASPSSADQTTSTLVVDLTERLGGAGSTGQHARLADHEGGRRPRASAGSRAEVRSPSGVRSSARARATASTTANRGGSNALGHGSDLPVAAIAGDQRHAGKSARRSRSGKSVAGVGAPALVAGVVAVGSRAPADRRPGCQLGPSACPRSGRRRRPIDAEPRLATTPRVRASRRLRAFAAPGAARSWPAAAIARRMLLRARAGRPAVAPDRRQSPSAARPVAPADALPAGYSTTVDHRPAWRRWTGLASSPVRWPPPPGRRTPCPRAASSTPDGWRRARPSTPPRPPPTGRAATWRRRDR